MALISFKCPNCDGELVFSPETQNFKCEYCFSAFSQEELEKLEPEIGTQTVDDGSTGEYEENFDGEENQTNDSTEEKDAVIYSCPSCGAEIVTDETTAATFCYYCHNPVILGGKLEGRYLPNKVIPFEMTKEQAVTRFLGYVGKKKFIPKAFFNKKQIESMSGVYFPYWLYNTELDAKMSASARKVRSWRTGDIQHTETKHFHVEREGEVVLKNLTENALRKANAKLASGIMPYDFRRMKDFNMGYLSGFLAERRDIEQNQVQAKMQEEMRDSAKNLMRETLEYSSATVESFHVMPTREEWFYCLLPVWTVTYKGKNGQIYYYSMNGQTGEVCGELPVDYKKVTLTSLLIAAGILVVGLIGGFFI